MKIIVEANIPYMRGLLEPFGTVDYLPADAITADAVKTANALFVRTRTHCNRSLLDGSNVEFIATATIGTDHIDLDYCQSAGIDICNAPGCNAPAVAQYVFATIGRFLSGRSPEGIAIGVVGVGNVGSIVARWGERLGMHVLRCDPPRQKREQSAAFVALEAIAREAEIITFHTPLTKAGENPTWHLADENFLNKLGTCRLLLNSARGGVVDNGALSRFLDRSQMKAAIDCWENEPNINRELLDKTFVATPHIAGYSAEGKARATAMALAGFERHFGVTIPNKPIVSAPPKGADINSIEEVIASYNPLIDTACLKASPSTFELQRNNYKLRHETSNTQC